MNPLVPWLVVLPLLGFWVWMFWDMSTNDYHLSSTLAIQE